MKSKLLIFWIRCRLGWFRWVYKADIYSRSVILGVKLILFMIILHSLAPLLRPYLFFNEIYLIYAFLCITFIYSIIFNKHIQQRLKQRINVFEAKLKELYVKYNFNYIDQIAVDKLYTFATSIIPAILLSVFSIIILSSDTPLDWALIAGIILLLALNLYFLFRLLSNLIQFINLTK